MQQRQCLYSLRWFPNGKKKEKRKKKREANRATSPRPVLTASASWSRPPLPRPGRTACTGPTRQHRGPRVPSRFPATFRPRHRPDPGYVVARPGHPRKSRCGRLLTRRRYALGPVVSRLGRNGCHGTRQLPFFEVMTTIMERNSKSSLVADTQCCPAIFFFYSSSAFFHDNRFLFFSCRFFFLKKSVFFLA